MPLATSVLQANLQRKIKSILDASFNENSNAETIKTKFAKDLSSAIAYEIDTWIKTATITVNAGIPVATAGSPTAQTGATTGPGTATIM